MDEDFVEDRTAYPVLIQLAACLEEEIQKRRLPKPNFSGVLPGSMALIEYCGFADDECGGQAWTRQVNEFASTTFPEPDVRALCTSPMAFTIEVGVVRCIGVGDDDGSPLTMAEQLAATRLQLADKAAARAAIQCCVGKMDLQYNLGEYTPYGPEGGCVGGFWTITVQQDL